MSDFPRGSAPDPKAEAIRKAMLASGFYDSVWTPLKARLEAELLAPTDEGTKLSIEEMAAQYAVIAAKKWILARIDADLKNQVKKGDAVHLQKTQPPRKGA